MVKPKSVPFKKESSDVVASTVACLSFAGMNSVHSDWVRKGGAALLVQFMDDQLALAEKNPYEISVGQKLAALHCANDEEGWGIADEEFIRLSKTVPAVPKGKNVYLSLRIRWGEGSEGVQQTFERHVARIKWVFGEGNFWCLDGLHSGKERLRLLNGDHTHKPVVEWVIVDLGTHRQRDSIVAVRGSKSLADELLVVAWMFPEMIRAIDYGYLAGLFAAGYEVNQPEDDDEAWQSVVRTYFDHEEREACVSACRRDDDDPDYSVPVLLP
jgi:hypothetical protein